MNFCPNCGKPLASDSCDCGFKTQKNETVREQNNFNINENVVIGDVKNTAMDAIMRPFDTVGNVSVSVKISLIVIAVQAVLFGMFVDIALCTGISGLSRGSFKGDLLSGSFTIKIFLASAIIYMISILIIVGIIYLTIYIKDKTQVKFERVFGIIAYALIMPTAFNVVGVLMGIINPIITICMAAVALMVFVLISYEGISSLKVVSKNNIIYAIGCAISIGLLIKYYFVIKAIVDIVISSVRDVFRF